MSDFWPFFFCFTAAFARAAGMVAILPGLETFERGLLLLGFTLVIWNGGAVAHLSVAGFASEILIGILLALPCVLALEVAQMCGELFDLSRGQTSISLFDPTVGQVSICGLGNRTLFWSLLTASGFLLALFKGAIISQNLLPLGLTGTIDALSLSAIVVRMFQKIFCLLVLLAFPIFVALSGIELLAGFVSKLFPEWKTSGELAFVKTLAGFYLLINLSQNTQVVELMPQPAQLVGLVASASSDPGGIARERGAP